MLTHRRPSETRPAIAALVEIARNTGAVLYVGRTGSDGSAEQMACGYLNFFASPASAAQWASGHSEVTGSVLDQVSAETLGAETFGSLLDGAA